jgi:hypothetical protein
MMNENGGTPWVNIVCHSDLEVEDRDGDLPRCEFGGQDFLM